MQSLLKVKTNCRVNSISIILHQQQYKNTYTISSLTGIFTLHKDFTTSRLLTTNSSVESQAAYFNRTGKLHDNVNWWTHKGTSKKSSILWGEITRNQIFYFVTVSWNLTGQYLCAKVFMTEIYRHPTGDSEVNTNPFMFCRLLRLCLFSLTWALAAMRLDG